jgi:hypothetical protein
VEKKEGWQVEESQKVTPIYLLFAVGRFNGKVLSYLARKGCIDRIRSKGPTDEAVQQLKCLIEVC